MGCAQSKIDNEESVSRCKDRRNFMKEAVSARNAFAAGHSGYTIALKNTGAALSDYAQGEAEEERYQQHQQQLGGIEPVSEPRPPPPPHIMEPPPPPPLPSFSPSPKPLLRSVTLPEFPVSKPIRKMKNLAIAEEDEDEDEEEIEEMNLRRRKRQNGHESPPVPPPPPESKGMAWDYFFMVDNMPTLNRGDTIKEHDDEEEYEEEEEEEEGGGFDQRYAHIHNHVGGNQNGGAEPKTPEKVVMEGFTTEEEETPVVVGKERQFMHSNTAPSDLRIGNTNAKVGSSANLLKILTDIDDHFLKASECAQGVSKMLEATRLHYHSNFADNRGHIDHAERVMRVITWNRSFRGVSNGNGGKDEADLEDYETHATILDKLLAWEKKLYEEVKAGELMKLEYQRKVGVLNRLKKRGASTESLEKTKAAVSHLHTRYIVDMQSLDSTVSEVDEIRDQQLYPKLVTLVDGMYKMWESMYMHHEDQLKIVTDLKSLDISGTPKETSKHHHERTIQLGNVVQEWHSQFNKLITHQKQYVQSLNSWLKLNLIPIESNLKEKVSSPPHTQNPPIQSLLHFWHDHLEKLPDELAKSAISSFAAVIETIIIHQDKEMKLKEKCEETRREYIKKSQSFDDWYQKYAQKRMGEDTDPDKGVDVNVKDPVSEKRFVVESLKKRLEDEIEAHQKHCVQVRDKSLGSLKTRLPELFRAMTDYSRACADAYERLRSTVPNPVNQNGS